MIKVLKGAIDWILFTSMFAACCSVGLCMATERLLIDHIPTLFIPLHVLVFGSTLMVYNAHNIAKRSRPDISDRFDWSQYHKLWHYFLLGAGAIMCAASLLVLSWKMLIGCIVLGLLSFAYSLPLLPFKDKKRLRDFGWIKILVLTSVWTIVTSILPMLYWGKIILHYPFEILIRFVFLFTLCVAFDIRDMQTDLDADIYTLPNLIGEKNSYKLMNNTILLFVLLSVFQDMRHPSALRLGGQVLTAAATYWVIRFTRKHPSDRAYLGLVDGMMLLYAILILLQ